MGRLFLRLAAALGLASIPAAALADDNRPLTITIEQDGARDFRATWKIPVNVEARHLPALTPPGPCRATGDARSWSDPLGHWREERWRCSKPFAGSAIAIAYPLANPNLATIARVRVHGDSEQTLLLQPQESILRIPAAAESQGTFVDFLRLGIEHIWTGFDHLLFVAGLIFIAGSPRRVLATVTGFTIAHSTTLALSALDLVRLPRSAIEGVIALSIVFLAVEIVKGPRDTLTWRQPLWVAASFGLLHGFGFASVLRDVGLPENGLIEALLAFNLGIEAGQIAFAALVLTGLTLIRRLPSGTRFARRVPKFAGYAVGILASNWMIGRLLSG